MRPVLRRVMRVAATVVLDARSGFTGAARPVLTVSALVMITAAAWTVALGLGLFVGGLCALFLEFLLSPDDANPGVGPRSKSNR